MKDRIQAYMGDGLTAAQTATILGCSPAYISQLLKNEDFKAAVNARLASNQKPAEELLDTRYESLEHSIVKEMSVAVVGAELPHLTRALEAVSKARDLKQKQKHPMHGLASQVVNIVSLSLPQHALASPVIEVSAKGEVLAIDNQVLAPMSSKGVEAMFTKIGQKVKGAVTHGGSTIPEFEAPSPA